MADNGWMARAKLAAKEMLGLAGPDTKNELVRAENNFMTDPVSVSMLLGSGRRQARSRAAIYMKWHYMAGDPIVSTALRAHVTMALGGDEHSGDCVFIEQRADIDKAQAKIVDEIKADLEPLFNRIVHQVAFNATAYGDAYGRVYSRDREGLLDVATDEMFYPPLIQPYERGGKTVGFVISTGDKFVERLSIKQMARLKMPRTIYTAQVRVVEKSMQTKVLEDDIDNLPYLPALAGGSFLEGAEEAYDNLMATLTGLVGQRILNSIDESMIGANLEGMTLEQRKEFMKSLKGMLTASKKRAEDAIREGRPVTERVYHIMPTFSEKQMTSISQFNGTSGATSISVEDVMFHAKLLAGALGIDLSMLGFSDILSGGLGEGGFFRTSAQAAERSRIIRVACSHFFSELIDLHTLTKYGWVFDEKDRPYRINYYGANSALESEKQASRERSMNATSIMLTAVNQLKDIGLDVKTNKMILEQSMELDGALSDAIANSLASAPDDENDDAGGHGF